MNRGNFRDFLFVRGWIWLAPILLLVLFIRWRLADMPLERDEGEYAYPAQLLLQGLSPYDYAYNIGLKLPGTTVAYAFFMALFGQTATAIRIGAMIANLISTVLVFVLARRMFGMAAGIAGAGTFALLSIVPETLGLMAHATHFVMLPALAGIVLLQKLDDKTASAKIFFAGLFLGLAVVMKQSGAFFGLFAVCWILHAEFVSTDRQWRRFARRASWLALGGVLPLAFTCAVVALVGDFGSFWFWTIQYASAHETILSFKEGCLPAFADITDQLLAAPALWAIALVGLAPLFFSRVFTASRFFVASLFAFSFLAVCPGWYFRAHYFIQWLPAGGLLASVTFRAMAIFLAQWKTASIATGIAGIIFAAAGTSSLIYWADVYFILTPADASRAIYDKSPFSEAREISDYLAKHSSPEARIFVLGSEPEIYFYSQRRSASGYICMYPLTERQPYQMKMQKQMIQEVESAAPAYVVFVNIRGSWIQATDQSDKNIFEWWKTYSTNYDAVGMVDMFDNQPSQFFWNAQLTNRTNPSPPAIYIFRRK